MSPAPPHLAAVLALSALSLLSLSSSGGAWRPWAVRTSGNLTFGYPNSTLEDSKKFEGSSEFVHLRYHMGPVLASNTTVHLIWYGRWRQDQKRIIRAFIGSISASEAPEPSVASWWRTATLYTDQSGGNVSRSVALGSEKNDRLYSRGKSLTRLSMQEVIKNAITARTRPLLVHPRGGVYLILTSDDVYVQDLCTGACGFHYFTFPSIVGYTLPYAWVGNSARFCPGTCAYPFAVPPFVPGQRPLKPPNGDVGVEGMVSVIGHELAEISTNPLINAWFAGTDPMDPVEIADLCEGIYGTGGGGSYIGQLLTDHGGSTYNLNGRRRRFLVQWLWHPDKGYCTGPNALDQ